MPPRSRRELVQLLDDRMSLSYDQLKDHKELEPKMSLVKTYLVETKLPEEHDGPAYNYAKKITERMGGGKRPIVRTLETDDSNLVTITSTYRGEGVTLFADVSNQRYWQVHSVDNSDAVDWLVHRLINSGPELDRAWFPSHLLEYFGSLGSFRGLSLDYDRRVIPDVDLESNNAPVDVLKMHLRGNRATDILAMFRDQGGFASQTTVSRVKVRYASDIHGGYFTLDDIKYDGKMTARGTSFETHLELVSAISDKYSSIISHIERHSAMSVIRNSGSVTFKGEPINIMFPRPIANLGIFCDRVFSCLEPFRLWGVPVQLSPDYYRVSAVDLHVGSEVTFEISPEWMRIYLSASSCGNTVIRIFTNLQHHYDAKIEAVDGDGRTVVGV